MTFWQRRVPTWIVIAGSLFIVVAVVGGAYVLATPGVVRFLDDYQVVGDDTLLVATVTGTLEWTRVTSVVETSSEVSIEVRSNPWPLPQSSEGHATTLTVNLEEPLGSRRVIDPFHVVPLR